jgi:CHAD domain-containing protein
MESSISLLPALEALRRHLPAALDGHTPEGLHQVRVAARRLGAWCQLAGLRVLGADLRWLRRAAGAVRDLDVLLGLELPAGVRRWLEEERAAARAQLLPRLEGPRCAALLEALANLPPLTPATARTRLARLERRVARRRARVLGEPRGDARTAPGARESLHSLRRALRQLRYAREWLGLPTGDLSPWQQRLGELNDLDQFARRLAACPEAGALVELRADVEARVRAAERLARRSLRGASATLVAPVSAP